MHEYVDTLIAGYITDQYESSGAVIRIAMNALPAAVFLVYRKRFTLSSAQSSFWTWMAWCALAFIPIMYISPSSTAVDRVALYWIPLQLFVWSRAPEAVGHPGGRNALWVYIVLAYSALVYIIWLLFATNAPYWLPYQFYPWIWLWQ